MKIDGHNLKEKALDAILGYSVVVLALLCFMATMWFLTAGIRLIIGLS